MVDRTLGQANLESGRISTCAHDGRDCCLTTGAQSRFVVTAGRGVAGGNYSTMTLSLVDAGVVLTSPEEGRLPCFVTATGCLLSLVRPPARPSLCVFLGKILDLHFPVLREGR